MFIIGSYEESLMLPALSMNLLDTLAFPHLFVFGLAFDFMIHLHDLFS